MIRLEVGPNGIFAAITFSEIVRAHGMHCSRWESLDYATLHKRQMGKLLTWKVEQQKKLKKLNQGQKNTNC